VQNTVRNARLDGKWTLEQNRYRVQRETECRAEHKTRQEINVAHIHTTNRGGDRHSDQCKTIAKHTVVTGTPNGHSVV